MLNKIITALLISAQLLSSSAYIGDNIKNFNSSPQTQTQAETHHLIMPSKFATKDEGIEFFKNNKNYYSKLNQTDLNWRMCKKGAKLDEYKKFALKQVEDFEDEETLYYMERLGEIQDSLNALGYDYKLDKQIIFVKTTMKEEMDAAGYTFDNYIFLSDWIYKLYLKEGDDANSYINSILAHEIFHVLTRNDPSFREKMYKAIDFEIGDEPEFSDEVKKQLVTNPDVEKYDCYSYFTHNNQKKKGTIVSYYTSDYLKDEYVFDHIDAGIVFYDEPNKIYPVDEIPDFYDVVGKNTDYVIAAEECMADNFSFALSYDPNYDYKDPEIIEYIIKNLK